MKYNENMLNVIMALNVFIVLVNVVVILYVFLSIFLNSGILNNYIWGICILVIGAELNSGDITKEESIDRLNDLEKEIDFNGNNKIWNNITNFNVFYIIIY
jgi:hypothetical protein